MQIYFGLIIDNYILTKNSSNKYIGKEDNDLDQLFNDIMESKNSEGWPSINLDNEDFEGNIYKIKDLDVFNSGIIKEATNK